MRGLLVVSDIGAEDAEYAGRVQVLTREGEPLQVLTLGSRYPLGGTLEDEVIRPSLGGLAYSGGRGVWVAHKWYDEDRDLERGRIHVLEPL